MKRLTIAVAALIALAVVPGHAEDVERTIQTQCASTWKTDFEMRAYCERKQRQAVAALERGKPSEINDQQFAAVRAACANQWPVDYEMRAYCERKQWQAIASLANGRPEDVTERQFNAVRMSCANQWPADYEMRAYCERKQWDALRELRRSGSPVD